VTLRDRKRTAELMDSLGVVSVDEVDKPVVSVDEVN